MPLKLLRRKKKIAKKLEVTPSTSKQPIKKIVKKEQNAIVCALDRSSSMGGTKIETAKKTLKNLLEEHINIGDYAGIVSFSTDSGWDYTFKRISDNKDKKNLLSAIDKINATGGTALWDAIALAYHQIVGANAKQKGVLVITDGGDNSSIKFPQGEAGISPLTNHIKQLVGEKSIKLRIIGIGDTRYRAETDLQGLNENWLIELTKKYGSDRSMYRFIDENVEDLASFLKKEIEDAFSYILDIQDSHTSLTMSDSSVERMKKLLNVADIPDFNPLERGIVSDGKNLFKEYRINEENVMSDLHKLWEKMSSGNYSQYIKEAGDCGKRSVYNSVIDILEKGVKNTKYPKEEICVYYLLANLAVKMDNYEKAYEYLEKIPTKPDYSFKGYWRLKMKVCDKLKKSDEIRECATNIHIGEFYNCGKTFPENVKEIIKNIEQSLEYACKAERASDTKTHRNEAQKYLDILRTSCGDKKKIKEYESHVMKVIDGLM